MAEYDFLEMMPDLVTIEKRTEGTQNGYPSAAYGPKKQYPGSLDAKPKMIRTTEGNESTANAIVIVATDWLLVGTVFVGQPADVISPFDRLTVGGAVAPILTVELVHDQTGLHHTVITTTI